MAGNIGGQEEHLRFSLKSECQICSFSCRAFCSPLPTGQAVVSVSLLLFCVSVGMLLGSIPLTISDISVIKHTQSLPTVAKQIHAGQWRLRLILSLLSLISDS